MLFLGRRIQTYFGGEVMPRYLAVALGSGRELLSVVPFIYSGEGVPTQDAPSGSFYFRRDGEGLMTSLYFRTGGAWVSIFGDFATLLEEFNLDPDATLADIFSAVGAGMSEYAKLADLASTALNKGAKLIGVDDGTVTGNPATVQAALVGHDTAIAARTIAADLVSQTNTKGAALVGLKTGVLPGNPATVEAALAAINTRLLAGLL